MEWSWRACLALIFIIVLPAVAFASDETVTEDDAVRLFLEQSPQAGRVPLMVQSVGADLRAAAMVQNPDIIFEVEDAGGVRDEFLTVNQELPLTGRLRLLRGSADLASEAAGLAAERDLQKLTCTVRKSFYEVLHREGVLDRLRQGEQLLERVVEILVQRERLGEGSGYDLLRAEQELAVIRIDKAEAETSLSATRGRLESFYDPALKMDTASLIGDFLPADDIPQPGEAIENALARRPDLRALEAEKGRWELARKAARRGRFPEPTVRAGWKRTEGLDLDDRGFVAALTVPLPLFDRGQHALAHATADSRRAELDREILVRRIRAEVTEALARERTARHVARRYGDQVEKRAADLRRIAQLAYEEGEAGILELLDAYRTSLSMELKALAVRYDVKVAEINRDRVIGTEVKP